MVYFHIAVVILAILACYKWGDRRHWDKYYSTILFFMMGDFIYLVLFRKTMLWMYNTEILNHTLINLIIIFTVYPATILTFIPHFPKTIFKSIGYILSWTALFAAMEFLSHLLGCISYHNGWSLGWSILFCLTMFPLQYLHYKKPILAWFLSIIKLAAYIAVFNVDIITLI